VQIGVVRAVGRINSAVHHRVHLAVAGQWMLRRAIRKRDSIANAGLADRFDRRRDVANFTRFKQIGRLHSGRAEITALHHREFRPAGHHPDHISLMDSTLLDADIDDHAFVGVIIRVKNQRLQRLLRITLRRRNVVDNVLQNCFDVEAQLGRNSRGVHRRNPYYVLNFLCRFFRFGARQIDLVDDRDDLQPGVRRKIGVRQGLSLDPLGGVHHQNRALTGSQRAGNLVVEVHMAGGINQVEQIILPVLRVINQRYGVSLDRDSALPFQIHIVEELIGHIAQRNRLGFFQNPVCQSGFSVVNMCNDTEIANSFAGNMQADHLNVYYDILLFLFWNTLL